MSFNRSIAKTRAVQRARETTAKLVNARLGEWHVDPSPYTPRCRHCGSKITSRDARCSTCWRAL